MRTYRRAGSLFASLCLLAATAVCEDPRRAFPQARAVGEIPATIKTDQRIALLEKQLEQSRANVRLQNQLASAYLQKVRETVDFGYLDRAERILYQVLAADEGNYEAQRMRGVVELERHHFQAAAEMGEALIQLHPNDPWNYGIVGDAAMEMGDYDRAGSAYQRMVALRPDQSSLNRAAWFKFVSGRPEAAIALMKEAIHSSAPSPENTAWCLVDLGNLYFKTGALDAAGDAYLRAVQTFPGYHAAEAGLGHVQAAQGNIAEAIAHYGNAQRSVPLPDYSAALEQLYTLSGKPDQAKKQLELIDFVDRMARVASEKTNRNLAVIYADEGRNLDRAAELAQEELKVRRDVYSYDALGWVLFQRKDYRGAEEAAAKALLLGTPEPAFYYHAGRIAAALEKKEEARELLKQALKLNPKFDLRQAPIAAEMLSAL